MKFWSTTSDFIANGNSASLPVGTIVETVGFYEEGDGGGAKWQLTANTGTPSQTPAQLGDALFNDALGRQWKLVGDGLPQLNVRKLGAVFDGVTDETGVINAACEYAYANKIRFVQIDGPMYVEGDVPKKANVIFVGNGTFTRYTNSDRRNIGIYRRQVIPLSAPSPSVGVDRNLIVKTKNYENCTVVFFGDSLSTYLANTKSSANCKSVYFQDMIQQSNPSANFTFYNRSIGGKNAAAMNGNPNVLTSDYGWYTDVGRDWLEYIYDLNPDVVVMATGMNENNAFNPQDIYDIRAKIEANTSAQIVFVADYCPALSPVGIRAGNSVSWYAAQEWRDRAAGFIRSYAKFIGYPLIDLNRTFGMVRDGRDILSIQYRESSNYTLADNRITTDNEGQCRAVSISCVIDFNAFTNADPMSITLSDTTQNNWYVWVQDNGAGKIKLNFIGGNEGANYVVTTDLDTPTVNHEFEFTVEDSAFIIKDKTVGSRYALYRSKCVKLGGLFRPSIGYFAVSGSGPVISVSSFCVGVESPVMPITVDQEFYGVVDAGSEDPIIGGDGYVHPSTIGLEALHSTHFKQQKLKVSPADEYDITVLSSEGASVTARCRESEGGNFIIHGTAKTDAAGNVSLTIPFTVGGTLRNDTYVTAMMAGGDAFFSPAVKSSGSSGNVVAISTYDAAGSLVGAKNFNFKIIGKKSS